MSDRELLELAARAAGEQLVEISGNIFRRTSGVCITRWNPLTDDGDALRLAVKLDIPVSSESVNGTVWVCRGELQVYELHSGDPYAATRRVIVRAAAEIGRSVSPVGSVDSGEGAAK